MGKQEQLRVNTAPKCGVDHFLEAVSECYRTEDRKPFSCRAMTPLPSYIDPEAWADYLAMRVRIKKPLTTRSVRQKLALLQRYKDAGWEVNAVIDTATERCWLDFYAPKDIEVPIKIQSTATVSGEAARYLTEKPGKPSDEARAALSVARSSIRRVA